MMIKSKWNILWLCALLLITSCLEEKDAVNLPPTVTTGTASDVYRMGAVLSGTIGGNATAAEFGIMLSDRADMVGATRLKANTAELTFSVQATDLQAGHTYYYCAYASSGYSTVTGEVNTFTTPESNAPVFGEITVVSSNEQSITVSVPIIDDGGDEILLCGFCWKEITTVLVEPTFEDNPVNLSVDADVLTTTITGLEPGSRFALRAFAMNADGMGYSETATATTTEATVPILSDIVAEEGDDHLSLAVEASIVNEGQSAVTEKGFCWSETNQQPSVADEKQVVADDGAVFSALLNNFKRTTTYYIRAYAVNDQGTGYGEVYQFTSGDPGVGIYSLADLLAYRDAKENHEDLSPWKDSNGVIHLRADIDLSSVGNWTPLELDDTETFDGNEHTIRNMNFSLSGELSDYEYGFFRSNLGTIRNVTLTGRFEVTEDAFSTAGGIDFGSFCSLNQGVIENCHSYVEVLANAAHTQCGGITQQNAYDGVIRNCTNHGNITATYMAGGIFAQSGSGINAVEAVNCINYGRIEVVGNSAYATGGIGGWCADATTTGCVNNGAVVAESGYVGGIYGVLSGASEAVVYTDNTNAGTVNGEPGSEYNAVGFDNRNADNDPSVTLPVISAVSVTDVTSQSAVISATVTDDGGMWIREQGFYYSTTHSMPDEGDMQISFPTTDEHMIATLTDLQEETTYYVRAYAINNKGIAYSEAVQFETPRRPGIFSVEDLVEFRELKNNGGDVSGFKDADGVFRLYADLDMEGADDWTSIRTIDAGETFDGNGHTIYNLHMTYGEDRNLSFVGTNNGTIQNLTLTGSFTASAEMTGAGTFCITNNGTMRECHSYVEISLQGGELHCGGLANNNQGLMEACSNHGNLNAVVAGGMVETCGDNGRIVNCNNYGVVTASLDGGGMVGGITSGTLSGCINEGTVTVTANGGGISARILNGSIVDCENRSTVNGLTVGGIVGTVENTVPIEISGNRHVGAVESAGGSAGGIIGRIYAGVQLNYNNNTNAGTVNGEAGSEANAIGNDGREGN